MKIALFGIGKMGQLIEKLAQEKNYSIVAKISSSNQNHEKIQEADLCIDFSTPDSVLKNISHAARYKKNLVIGTTGWYHDLEIAEKMVADAKIGAIFSPNFSIGVQLFFQIVEEASKIMQPFKEYDTALLDVHHSQKKDTPSGTGYTLAKIVETHKKMKCPTSSVRTGACFGTHTVFFDSSLDQITLTHDSRSREGFASGAIVAAEWIMGKKGFYNFSDVMRGKHT